jgi:hypothetical protein
MGKRERKERKKERKKKEGRWEYSDLVRVADDF